MKNNIAIITGGYSSENVVSYQSAENVCNNIDESRFNVYLIDISLKGWFYRKNDEQYSIDKNDFSITMDQKKIKFDLCYIMIHGTPGEDGKLQSYFELINQKYISCNAIVSALTFNKYYTTAVLRALNFNIANSVLLIKSQTFDTKKIIHNLKFPVFVKPNNGGSSIGISKVKEPAELESAIYKAFKEDDQVIIEEQIVGQEFTVGVYAFKKKKYVLPITEIKSHNDFFDFEAKYKGKSLEVTPAYINAILKHKIEILALEVYEKLNCAGVIRIDLIYNTTDKELFILEINTVPGQTHNSIVPQQIMATKSNLKKFYTQLFNSYLNLTTY